MTNCDLRTCTFRSADPQDFALCEAPGCGREHVCLTHIHQCEDCRRFFCRDHIVASYLFPGHQQCEACVALACQDAQPKMQEVL